MAGVAGCAAGSGERPAAEGPAAQHQRHSVAHPHRHAVARRAPEVRQVDDGLPTLPPLEPDRGVGGDRHHAGPGDGQQQSAQHRQHDGSGACVSRRRKRGTREQAFGQSRGGFTCKVHCISDAGGIPLGFHLTGGEAADCKAYKVLIELPEQAPDALLADKGYDSDAIRDDLKQRGIRAVIPPRSNRTATIRWNRCDYKQRNRIERSFGHLKINRAVATRYDKLARSFLDTLHLALTRSLLRFVNSA